MLKWIHFIYVLLFTQAQRSQRCFWMLFIYGFVFVTTFYPFTHIYSFSTLSLYKANLSASFSRPISASYHIHTLMEYTSEAMKGSVQACNQKLLFNWALKRVGQLTESKFICMFHFCFNRFVSVLDTNRNSFKQIQLKTKHPG